MRATIRRTLRVLVRGLALALLALALVAVVTPMGRYISRAAWEEARILARRQPISELVADSATTPALRQRLTLVVDARRFAVQQLGLSAGESFTTFSRLERDTLVLVLSAARRDTLALHTWWFPVVGRVPYKGFFDFAAAERARAGMQSRGFDTNLRPAAAFSTLGWFNDPLLSTTVRLDTVSLAGTVIHELVHNTLFARNHVAFNESFASFVGARGSAEFFRMRGAHAAAQRADDEWEDDKRLGIFWEATVRRIDSVYALPGIDSAARVRARDTVYAQMRRVLVDDIAPRMLTLDAGRLARIPLDNATLLARRVYARDLEIFDDVHRRAGGPLRATIELVSRLVREGKGADPFELLRAFLSAERP
jgi:predicted aminopeptidase